MSVGTVVVVPGFSGSELWTPPSFFGLGPRLKVWINYGGLAAGMWRWLALGPDGQTPTFPGVGAIYPGPPLAAYYGTLCTSLAQSGWDVVSAALDWRELIALDGQRLAGLIGSMAGLAPIHIVAHSRAGLVTRSALSILRQSGQLGLVGRVAGLGVPHQGSWEAAGLLAGWQRWCSLLRNLLQAIPGAFAGDALFGDLQTVVTTWPAVYQLLPAPFASGVPTAALQALYDPAAWQSIGRPVSAAWLDAARQSWVALPIPPASIPWLDVVGSGHLTPIYPALPRPPLRPIDLIYTELGDGVVPVAWASQPDRPRYTSRASHAALVVDGGVSAAVNQWLIGKSPDAPQIDRSVQEGQPPATFSRQ